MPEKALKAHLEELRTELEQAESLDADTRRTLAELADSIEKVLSDRAGAHESLQDRIESTTLEFEARHPGFAQILSQVSDTLAKLGI